QHVAGLEHRLGGRLRLEGAVGPADADDEGAAAHVADRLAGAATTVHHLDLLEAVAGVDLDCARDLRVQRQARHLRTRGLVRRDDAVGAGAPQLRLGVLARGAGHDRGARVELAYGQRDEDVLGVGVHARHHRAGALDAGAAQRLVVAGLALDHAHADAAGLLEVVRVGVDHHVPRAGRPEVARHLSAHAAVAADDEVVGGGVDHALRAAFLEQLGEVP